MKERPPHSVSFYMMPLPLEYQKTSLYLSVVVTAFLGAFVLQALVPSVFAATSSLLRGDSVQVRGASYVPAALQGTPVRSELTIANNGFVKLSGARIVAAGNGMITVQAIWSGTIMTWVILHSGATYYGDSGEEIDSGALSIGDQIIISGTLQGTTPNPTIDAEYIRLAR